MRFSLLPVASRERIKSAPAAFRMRIYKTAKKAVFSFYFQFTSFRERKRVQSDEKQISHGKAERKIGFWLWFHDLLSKHFACCKNLEATATLKCTCTLRRRFMQRALPTFVRDRPFASLSPACSPLGQGKLLRL